MLGIKSKMWNTLFWKYHNFRNISHEKKKEKHLPVLKIKTVPIWDCSLIFLIPFFFSIKIEHFRFESLEKSIGINFLICNRMCFEKYYLWFEIVSEQTTERNKTAKSNSLYFITFFFYRLSSGLKYFTHFAYLSQSKWFFSFKHSQKKKT